MGRGRSIDKTLPLTRSLTAQRDYRARKAGHLKEMEATVAHLRDENAALRAEVADLRARLYEPDVLPPSHTETVATVREQLAVALRHLDGLMSHPTPPCQERRPLPPGSWERQQPRETREPNYPLPQYVAPSPLVNDIAPRGPQRPPTPPGTAERLRGSPQLSLSPRANEGPRPITGLDPNCCSGLFDCSLLDVLIENDRPVTRDCGSSRGCRPKANTVQMASPPQESLRSAVRTTTTSEPRPADPDSSCCLGLVNCSGANVG